MNKSVLAKVGGCVTPSSFSESRGPDISQLLSLALQSFNCKAMNGPEFQLSGKLTHSFSALGHRVGKQKEFQLTLCYPYKAQAPLHAEAICSIQVALTQSTVEERYNCPFSALS